MRIFLCLISRKYVCLIKLSYVRQECVQFILVRTNMEGRYHLFIFVLGPLLMPHGVLPLNVPLSPSSPVQTVTYELPSYLEAPNSPPLCLSESCVLTAAKLLKQMDRNVEPCQDFYRFACGGFVADTVLPEDRTRTGFSL